MLSIGGYIKLILKKRNITVAELARNMTEQERQCGSSITIHKTHLNAEIKGDKISIVKARKIEIALDLPKFQLVKLIKPNLSEKQLKLLENVYYKA